MQAIEGCRVALGCTRILQYCLQVQTVTAYSLCHPPARHPPPAPRPPWQAHNIDNICIEVMSINFRVPTLEACNRNVSRMESEIARLKATDATRLNDEYQRLVSGLAQSGAPHTPCSLPPYTPLTSLPTPP